MSADVSTCQILICCLEYVVVLFQMGKPNEKVMLGSYESSRRIHPSNRNVGVVA